VKLTLDFRADLWFNIRMLNVIDKLNDRIENVVNHLIALGEWVENSLVALGERFDAAFDRWADRINK
jgi:hypothetical protein